VHVSANLPVEQLTSPCLLYSIAIQASGEQQTEWSIAQVPWQFA